MSKPGLLLYFLVALRAHALVVQGESSANHQADATSAPLSVWNNVGIAGDSTGEYLGNGWIITANHVARTDANHVEFQLTLGSVSYGWTGTGFQLGSHDIFLARLAPDGGGNLPDAYGATGLALATTTPAIGTATSLIGYGRNTASIDYYTVSGTTWTASTAGNPNSVGVYTWGTAPTKTWGTNRIWGSSAAGSMISGSPVSAFTIRGDSALAIDFSNTKHGNLPQSADVATSAEAGAALNDSGGALLVKVGGSYQLAGLIDSITSYQGQPANSTTASNSTLAVDLSAYAAEINAVIVPEPSSATLLLAGALLWARRRRR